MTLSSPDIIKAKETCKDLDEEATLFYTEIDPQGVDLLADLFIDWDEGINLGFMINHTGLFGECTFIQYDGQDITTQVEGCNGFIYEETQIICIRKSQPTQILGRHLAAIKQSQTAIETQGITVDSSTIPAHIGNMARTLSSQQKKTRTGMVYRSNVSH